MNTPFSAGNVHVPSNIGLDSSEFPGWQSLGKLWSVEFKQPCGHNTYCSFALKGAQVTYVSIADANDGSDSDTHIAQMKVEDFQLGIMRLEARGSCAIGLVNALGQS